MPRVPRPFDDDAAERITASKSRRAAAGEDVTADRRKDRQGRRRLPRRATLDPNAISPTPAPDQADLAAVLLFAGLSIDDVLRRMYPDASDEAVAEAAIDWLRSEQMARATDVVLGGRWETLDPDRRLELALNKHYAELARFLLTVNFRDADGLDLKKLESAREALSAKVEGREGAGDLMVAFLKDVMAGKVKAQATAGLGDLPMVPPPSALRPGVRRHES